MSGDGRRFSPSAERNREPILKVLTRVLPKTARVLEIASGSGTHAAWFVPRLPGITWQPSDPDLAAVASIEAWRAHLQTPRLLPALQVDVTQAWTFGPMDVVYCANMIHISPWKCTVSLLAGAAQILPSGGAVILYGPFHIDGPTGPGNEQFDASLRGRDPTWGIRELAAVQAEAQANGLVLHEIIEMPADNRTLVFRRN